MARWRVGEGLSDGVYMGTCVSLRLIFCPCVLYGVRVGITFLSSNPYTHFLS